MVNNAELLIKVKVTLIHLLLSLLVASLAAYLVFGIWFTYPYNEVSGGRDLFWLIIWVDICCGPLLTFVLFTHKKSRKELTIDLSLVAIIQLAALVYGLYSVMLARPIHLVYEVDRFRVITLADIDSSQLPLAKQEFQQVSFFGPTIIAAHVPKSTDADYMSSVELSMRGVDVSARPSHWVPYNSYVDDVLRIAKPLNDLKLKNPEKIEAISTSVKETGLAENELKYLPMQGRSASDWVVLINATTAEVVGFAHVDGF